MSSNLSEPRVPLTHQVPGPSYGVLMDKSLVEVSEGGGYFLAEILDVNNTDLFLRFENPRFSQEPFWAKQERVRPQPPLTINEDIEYSDDDLLDFFHEPSGGWWQARVLSTNHPFYLVEFKDQELIVHINQTRPCNSLSIQPLLTQLFHHEETIPPPLAKVWAKQPQDLLQIRRESGAVQLRFDPTNKVIILGNQEAITRAKLLLEVVFQHFSQIHEYEESSALESQAAPPSSSTEPQILSGVREVPIQELTIEQRDKFDDEDLDFPKYKAEFLLPVELLRYSFGRDEEKVKRMQKADCKLFIFRKELTELSTDKEQQKGERQEKQMLVTVLGLDSQSVEKAADQLNVTSIYVPIQEYLAPLMTSRLDHVKKASRIEWFEWEAYARQDNEAYLNLRLIGRAEAIETCKLMIQKECDLLQEQREENLSIPSSHTPDYYERPGSSHGKHYGGGGGGYRQGYGFHGNRGNFNRKGSFFRGGSRGGGRAGQTSFISYKRKQY